jgi:hypothetical protein
MHLFKYDINFLEEIDNDLGDFLKESPKEYRLKEFLCEQVLCFESILISEIPSRSKTEKLISTESN